MLALCGLCLLCTAVSSQAAPAPEPAKSGAELDKAIKANVEAQDYQEETAPIRAQIIKGEPAALIASGTGDISTIGTLYTSVALPSDKAQVSIAPHETSSECGPPRSAAVHYCDIFQDHHNRQVLRQQGACMDSPHLLWSVCWAGPCLN